VDIQRKFRITGKRVVLHGICNQCRRQQKNSVIKKSKRRVE
jgi:hypothetical protein